MYKMKNLFYPQISHIARTITTATTIRWFGWGIVETIIPVLVFSIVGSYGQTGIISSIPNIIFLICLPIVGFFADSASLRRLLLIGLGIYFLVGGAYIIAASVGSVLFLVIAKTLNGLSSAIDDTSRETAFLRYDSFPGRAFAFFETITNFWWLIAIIISLFTAPVVHIKWLFGAVIIGNGAAIFYIARLPNMHAKKLSPFKNFSVKKIKRFLFKTALFRNLQKRERFPILFGTFIPSFFLVLPTTFLPIFSYMSSNDIRSAILVGGLSAIPGIISVFIGKYNDVAPRHSMLFGWGLLALSFIVFSYSNVLVMELAVAFIAGVAAQMIYLSSMVLVQQSTPREHLGNIDSMLNAYSTIGKIIGGITIGFLIDVLSRKALGLGIASLILSGSIVLLLYWKS